MATLLLIAVFLLGALLLGALFLWLGARWVRASKPYYRNAVIAVLVLGIKDISFLAAASWFLSQLGDQEILALLAWQVAFLIAQVIVSCLVIQYFFRTTFGRAALVWLVNLIPGIAALGVAYLVIRPYVFEAFVVPTNSMAPTVIGWHQASVCPQCQGLLIVPSPPPEEAEERQQLGFEEDKLAICTLCQKASRVKKDDSSILAPDRIVVNKLLTPRRWDMIVFRHPDNPSVKYVMRLVALPGETVHIKENAIWINDVRAEPPAELAGLRYTTEVDGGLRVNLGTLENPLRLGQDQYCVLGDFSERSSDSRFWGSVPGSNIEGVVSLCYWPVSRWKIHR